MRFSFSKDFDLALYQRLLRNLASEIDTYRLVCNVNVRDIMESVHISHKTLKKCSMVSR